MAMPSTYDAPSSSSRKRRELDPGGIPVSLRGRQRLGAYTIGRLSRTRSQSRSCRRAVRQRGRIKGGRCGAASGCDRTITARGHVAASKNGLTQGMLLLSLPGREARSSPVRESQGDIGGNKAHTAAWTECGRWIDASVIRTWHVAFPTAHPWCQKKHAGRSSLRGAQHCSRGGTGCCSVGRRSCRVVGNDLCVLSLDCRTTQNLKDRTKKTKPMNRAWWCPDAVSATPLTARLSASRWLPCVVYDTTKYLMLVQKDWIT